MSGHSKWKNIAAKKGKTDATRGKVFTKLGRELLMAIKQGGPDPIANFKLKDIIAKCKANNMPNDTIEKAIKKASGEDGNKNYEEVIYEGYGPGGVAVIINTSTDNRNRTAAEIRHALDKSNGNLGTTGCVAYLFDKKGIIVIEKANSLIDEDALMMLCIDNGAEDFESAEEYYEITSNPSDFSKLRESLEKEGLNFAEAEVQLIPSTYITLNEKDSEKMQRLLDNLDELDDVIEVYHNWDQ